MNARLDQLLESLTETERNIGTWIQQHVGDASHMTIYEIADKVDVAVSSVSKFIKKLGYRGFREFRSDLLRTDFDQRVSVIPAITPTDPRPAILEKTLLTSIQTLTDAQSTIDDAHFSYAVNAIDQADTVAFFGFGRSSIMASMGSMQFQIAGVPTKFHAELHAMFVTAAELTPDDVAVVLSHSGTAMDLDRLLDVIEGTGCTVVAITSNPNSRLAKLASCILLMPTAQADSTPWTNMTQAISQMAVLDALYQAVLFVHGTDRLEGTPRHIVSRKLHGK